MVRGDGVRQLRITAVVRTAWGAVLLLMPERLLGAGTGRPIPAAAVTTVRVLGLRQLLQAGVAAARPTGPVARLSALVDTAHVGSCVGIAAWSPRWRRAALIDVLIEASFAASGWDAARGPLDGR